MTTCFSKNGLIDNGAHAPALPLDKLTKRQREVLSLLGEGLGRAEIAERLFRSPKTIDNHCTRIYEKLGVHSHASLVRLLHEHGALAETSTTTRQGDSSQGAQPPADALLQIESRLQNAPNNEYFHVFLLALCEALNVEISGICEVDHQARQFVAIAAVADGEPIGQMFGDFDSCQCLEPYEKGQYVLARGLKEHHPERSTLGDLGADAYAGIALEDRFVGKIGTLWIASKSPIEDPEPVFSVLHALHRRAATELALLLAIDKLDEAGISIGN